MWLWFGLGLIIGFLIGFAAGYNSDGWSNEDERK